MVGKGARTLLPTKRAYHLVTTLSVDPLDEACPDVRLVPSYLVRVTGEEVTRDLVELVGGEIGPDHQVVDTVVPE